MHYRGDTEAKHKERIQVTYSAVYMGMFRCIIYQAVLFLHKVLCCPIHCVHETWNQGTKTTSFLWKLNQEPF